MSRTINNFNTDIGYFLRPGNWAFWILISLVLKSALFYYKINEPTQFPNMNYQYTFGRECGDSRSYIDPIENFLKTGTYSSEIVVHYIASDVSYRDFRMPGYGAVYFLLRQGFDTSTALNALVLLQLILDAVSVYVLALIALIIFKTKGLFYLTFLLYAFSSYVSLYNHVIATESFCVAGLIFSLYYLLKQGNAWPDLLISGTFLTWCIFLRPVLAPLLILFSIYILLRNYTMLKKHNGTLVKSLLIFLFPFFIIDGFWIVRNYMVHKGFFPLTTSMFYPGTEDSVMEAVFRFTQSYGGSMVWWNSKNEINYFIPESKITDIKFPDHIFNEKFNIDSLALVKKLIIQSEDPNINEVVSRAKAEQAKEMLHRYTLSIKQDQPFLYYVSSRIKLLKSSFFHSGTGNLFEKPSGELSMPELMLKLFSSSLYIFIVVFGIIGSIALLLSKNKQVPYILLGAISLYLSLVHPVLLKFDEWRYFAVGYPFFLLVSAFVSFKLIYLVKKRKF